MFEKNETLDDRRWLVSQKPVFEVSVPDSKIPYNVFINVRNSVDYPYSRLFLTYHLKDSAGKEVSTKLVSGILFDPKSGAPHGTSGLGDLYDHQIPILKNHIFPYAGTHRIELEQFMRKDTLEGIVAVGVRVERAVQETQ